MVIGAILGVVIFILTVVAAAVSAVCFRKQKKAGGAVSLAFCALLVIAFLIVPFSFKTVDTGEMAVVKQLGEAKFARSAGTHFDLWITNTYARYDIKEQNVDITTAAYSSDAQTMDIGLTFQYHVIPDKVIDVAKEYGTLDILQSRIQSIVIEKTKSVLSSYKAMDIIADRASMSPMVEQAIKEAVSEKYYVVVSTAVLTNIDFSDAFEKAVEEKMIAEQNQLKQEYENTAKVNAAEAEKQATIKNEEAKAEADKIAAQAKVEIAKSDAEAKKTAAQAEADAILIQANAEAEALGIQALEVARMFGFTEIVNEKEQIKESLTIDEANLIKDYIEYIAYMEKWNGELPGTVVGDNAGIILPSN